MYLYFNNGILVFLKLQVSRDTIMYIAHSDIFTSSLPKSNVASQAFVLEVFCSNTGYEYRSDSFRGLPWVLQTFFYQ